MGRGRSQRTLDLVDAAHDILKQIQPATVRAVCYQLFVRKLIESMARNETNKVSKIVGPCPGGPLHFDRRRESAACLECERLATEQAKRRTTFTPRMTDRLRAPKLSTQRPCAVCRHADGG